MKRTPFVLTLLVCTLAFGCGAEAKRPKKRISTAHTQSAASEGKVIPLRYGYRVVAELPHSTSAYTQGLQWEGGVFYEGTGLNGRSELRVVNPATGEALKRVSLDRNYFGEGITLLGDRIYQLTWTSGKAFVYDKATLRKVGEHAYEGEGWGITTDGTLLYTSDGTDRITVRNPHTFKAERTIEVRNAGRKLGMLNELEWIEGEIWANVYMTGQIVRINPESGAVVGIVDLTGLQAPSDRKWQDDVLNGIAWDASARRLFVTGKNWNKIYQIELTQE
ncbi:MAG: glutaminyl-peptide cyclotransferase [Tidjanibacter sp.]|nr:glutaminyl-peptide cyclotransferase [Tidjanibacter sp.]